MHPPLDGFLAQDRADALTAEGMFADDVEGLVSAWPNVCGRWDDAVTGARRLPAAALDQRVAGEWSFVETLRHLVFVTDVWVGEVVEERTAPHHPWGLAPDHVPDAAATFGLDAEAHPSLDEVLEVRDERRRQVEAALAHQTPESLARRSAARDGRFTVVGALQTVLFEESAHLRYAIRDLAALG